MKTHSRLGLDEELATQLDFEPLLFWQSLNQEARSCKAIQDLNPIENSHIG